MPGKRERVTRTRERLAAVRAVGAGVAATLRAPLYQSAYDEGLGTAYTADHRPSGDA